MRRLKLTTTQRQLLVDTYEGNGHVSETYRPAQKLVELGLCEFKHGKFGGTWLDLTDAGRAALEEQNG